MDHLDFCTGHSFVRMFAAEIASDLRIHGHRFELRMESEVDLKEAPRIGREAFGRLDAAEISLFSLNFLEIESKNGGFCMVFVALML